MFNFFKEFIEDFNDAVDELIDYAFENESIE